MTAQVKDIIIYKGEKSGLCNNPLEQLWRMESFERPQFNLRSTANWRGYIATWEIKDDTLYLLDIKEDDPDNPRELIDIFPETLGKPVNAWWYTGRLRIVQGKTVNYIHGGYASRYKKEIYLTVRKGEVKDRQIKSFQKEDFIDKKTRKEKKQEEKVQKYVAELLRYLTVDKKKGKPPRSPKIKMIKKPGLSRKDQSRVIRFLTRRHEFFIDHMSGVYPLTNDLIEKYRDLWKWDLLSENPKLKWTDQLIERYEARWSWGEEGIYSPNIMNNDGINWTTDLVYTYKHRVEKELLAQKTNLLNKYPDVLDMITNKNHWQYISSNEYLPWTSTIIEKYEDYIDFKLLSGNRSVPWTDNLIAKYADRFDKERYEAGNYEQWVNKMDESIEKEEYTGVLKPAWSLSDDEYRLKYTENEFAEKLAESDWESLSRDECVPWTEELIDKYIDKWEWGHNEELDPATSWFAIPDGITEEEVFSGLSTNPALPWSVKLIKKYSDRIDWDHLSNNVGLPWSLSLVKKFRKKWSWNDLKWNQGMWEKVFYPYLDEESIGEIMEKVKD